MYMYIRGNFPQKNRRRIWGMFRMVTPHRQDGTHASGHGADGSRCGPVARSVTECNGLCNRLCEMMWVYPSEKYVSQLG